MDNSNDPIRQGRQFLKSNWQLTYETQSDQARGVAAPPQQKPYPAGSKIVDLVMPADLKSGGMPLRQAIVARKSRRKYLKDPLTLEELSFLLYCTQGMREYSAARSFRTVPSGGSRHCFETYLYIARVQGVEEGLYRYLPVDHKLVFLGFSAEQREDLDRGLLKQYWNAAVVFIWAAIPYRMEWRYTAVSHKIIALDAGHVCQNLYLACESIRCGACAIGAYDQELMDRFVGADGTDELVVYCAPVGRAEG